MFIFGSVKEKVQCDRCFYFLQNCVRTTTRAHQHRHASEPESYQVNDLRHSSISLPFQLHHTSSVFVQNGYNQGCGVGVGRIFNLRSRSRRKF